MRHRNERKRRCSKQQFERCKRIRLKNRQDEQWNERQAGIERPIKRIYVPFEWKLEKLLAKLEKYQDNGMFKKHDKLVTEKIRHYEERKAFTMVWILKIEECTTYSYKGNWEQARKKLDLIAHSNISVEYSDVIRARAMYLLVAHMRRKKKYRTSKTMLSHLIDMLKDCEQLLHNYNSPEDRAEFYQTFGCVRMDYMSRLPLAKRYVERENVMDCFRKAIYFSKQDPRERVKMKRQSYVHLKLAMIRLNDYGIERAERHLNIVQSKFRDILPTATWMLLYKTQSDLLFHKGQYPKALVKARKALKLAIKHGFQTELNTLQEKIDCYQKKLGTHDQILSVAFKEGKLGDRELDELAGKIAAKWERLGIHLNISQEVVDEIAVNESDKPKAMLLRWRYTSTSLTPYKELYKALCHSRVGLNNVAKEFCKETT